MAYNPTIWINDDGTGTVGTPVIADYMNNIEQGVKDNSAQINVLNEKFSTSMLSLMNGWTNYNDTVNITKIDRLVTITGVISGGVNTSGVVVANIPLGFRPKAPIGVQCFYSNEYNYTSAILIAYSDGNIQKADGVTAERINFSFSYYL